MKAWFLALSERERIWVLLGGFALIAMLTYFYGWVPLQRYKADLARDMGSVIEDRQFIASAQVQVQELEQAKQNQRVIDTNTSVQLLANPLLRRFQLDKQGVLVSSEARNKDAINLRLENAQFDALVRFIGEMERQHHIKVSNMALIPTKTTGLTDAQLTLER